jgi:hypothetical protein
MLASRSSHATSIPLVGRQAVPSDAALPSDVAVPQDNQLTFHFRVPQPAPHDGLLLLQPTSGSSRPARHVSLHAAEHPEDHQLLRELRELIRNPAIARVFLELFRPDELAVLTSDSTLSAAFHGMFQRALETAGDQPYPDLRLEESLENIRTGQIDSAGLTREAGEHPRWTATADHLLACDRQATEARSNLNFDRFGVGLTAVGTGGIHAILYILTGGGSTTATVATQCVAGALTLPNLVWLLCRVRAASQEYSERRSAATAQAATMVMEAVRAEHRSAQLSVNLALGGHQSPHEEEEQVEEGPVITIHPVTAQEPDARIRGLDEPDLVSGALRGLPLRSTVSITEPSVSP